jgi:type VII secretion integral membrane protein EccD
MSVCRVSIQTDRDGDPVTVDLALPSSAPIGELLPAIVDMVDGRCTSLVTGCRWRLDRLSGDILDESSSLSTNGVHDGELLILNRGDGPPLGQVQVGACQVVAAADPPSDDVSRSLPRALSVTAVVGASAALASTAGSGQAATNLIIAVVGTCGAAAVVVVARHVTAATVAVVALASAAGFLAVPSAPAAPNVFLASAAGSSAALLTMRLSRRASVTLTAVAALSVLTAAATLVSMPSVMTGAALVAASLVLLGSAPRLAVWGTALGPAHWDQSVADRAASGHVMLTGLVVGAGAGAASGAAVVMAAASSAFSASMHGVIALTALTAAVLLLRARTYVDPVRRITLAAAGSASAAACLRVVFIGYPQYAGWCCAVLVIGGLVAAGAPRTGAALSRALDRMEYAALAAVVPVACWAGGVYASFGGMPT